MFTKVLFLSLFSQFPYKITCSRTCTPNSHIFLNERLCYCDSRGQWKDPHCYLAPAAGRRQSCTPGHVVVQGCRRCVCQTGGYYSCVDEGCATGQSAHEHLAALLPWCVPLGTYYLNCHICVCPASGRAPDARCAFDVSCSFFEEPSAAEISSHKAKCIPKVMYILPCLRCVCSDQGHLTNKQCIVTCTKKRSGSNRRCIPNTLYKKGCNVCLCPDNSIPDDKICTNGTCSTPTSYYSLKNKQVLCKPHEFTKPKCIYCECNQDGGINENTCLDLECLQHEDFRYDVSRDSCNPGEMVPFCMEYLCKRNGLIAEGYCSKACSYESKLRVLERLIKSPDLNLFFDKKSIKNLSGNTFCSPESIYMDKNRICICPNSGFTNFSLCTASKIIPVVIKIFNNSSGKREKINYNGTCEPSTFVEFDCNACFCSKKGTIDLKWCTYDDCDLKRSIQESSKVNPLFSNKESQMPDTCSPGSILNFDCNFCICPDNGLIEDRVCTKNNCSNTKNQPLLEGYSFMCEPLAYFEVDCNICFCPGDGVKNVAKCTKNHCDKSLLRSEWCEPGQLFSSDCQVCVCPPNGDPADSACPGHDCSGSAPWAAILHLSKSLLSHRRPDDGDNTRKFELCFPGEEFFVGCKICVCPEVGLKMYAECSPSFCADGFPFSHNSEASKGNRKSAPLYRKLETRREECMTINVTDIEGRQKCTPGSMYIVRCKQCICPYAGSIAHYCRPLPEGFYCERAFPNVNFIPMGRRNEGGTGNASFAASNQNTIASSTTATRSPTSDTTSSTTATTSSTSGTTSRTTATTSSTRSNTATTSSTSGTTRSNTATTSNTSGTTRSNTATTSSTSGTTRSNTATTSSTSGTTRSNTATTSSTSGTTRSNTATTSSTSGSTNSTAYMTSSTSATISSMAATTSSTTIIARSTAAGSKSLHEHTVYACDAAGDVTDDCFRCRCDNRRLIAEHCFQNTADYCIGRKPSFLEDSPKHNHTQLDNNPPHTDTQLDDSSTQNHSTTLAVP